MKNYVEHGAYYVVNNFMVCAYDYERINGYGRAWHRIFHNPNNIAAYCKTLEDCGYKHTGDVELDET